MYKRQGKYTLEELKKCRNPQFQDSTNCKGNPNSVCYCDTNLNKKTYRVATQFCENLNGKIRNKRKKVCRHNLQNNIEYFNVTDLLKNCKDKEGAISYECIGNPKRICRCKSVFLWNVTRKEASKICKEENGVLTGSNLLTDIFFEYLSSKNPINKTIRNYTRFNLEENKSMDVEWSKPKNRRRTDLSDAAAKENDYDFCL